MLFLHGGKSCVKFFLCFFIKCPKKSQFRIDRNSYGRYFPDIASILTGFDMGSCQVAYDPKSKRCLATPRGKMTLELRTNIVTSHDDRFDIFRIRKYFIRGIGVALPTSCLAADISSDKIYKKRDEYIKNVIRAYRSNQRGYNRHADDMYFI